MSERQRQIARALLESLDRHDGGLVSEIVLHGESNLMLSEPASLKEFQDTLDLCDRSGWLTGVRPKHGGAKKWTLSDAGQAARLELGRP
jgi:hypothetical protein